jgi:hypothetical protein
LQGLKSLPKPKNDFEIVIPDVDEIEEAALADVQAQGTAAEIADAEEIERQRLEKKRQQGKRYS